MAQMSIRAFSGDLLNRCTSRNKRRHSLIGSTEEEVLVGFSDVFNNVQLTDEARVHILRTQQECTQYPKVQCNNYPRCHEFTVKIFVHKVSETVVHDAVSSILKELGFSFVDNVIVSIADNIGNKELDGIWKQMEKIKNNGTAGVIGMADLCVSKLQHLVDWASLCPDVMQICPLNYDELFRTKNSSVKQITEVGQKHNIRITTHNDPVGSPTTLAIDLDSLLDNTGKKWTTSYIARYTQRSKDRNIITMKGYCMGVDKI